MIKKNRIISIDLDEKTFFRRGPDIEQERKIAIYDLLEDNYFNLKNNFLGPYKLKLSIQDNHLLFQLESEYEKSFYTIALSLTPFRKIIKDYWVMCDSYFLAVRKSTPAQIETVDMARRSLHNEGSDILIKRLIDKVDLDEKTSRRLFTLICVLHLR